MADNDTPKIPSFKPTRKKEEKKGAGPLSGLGKTTGSSPMTGTGGTGGFKFPGFAKTGGSMPMKVRGLQGATTLMDRLKRLRKKDMAFIVAGLSVLLMAPVAEHFIMSPEDESGVLKQGFSTPGGETGLFPDGSSIYEAGTGGLSPGGLYGQGTDVITPLNVRDPAALVMGPGATKKPSAKVTAPPPPPKKDKGSWKDALAQAAKAGAKKASKGRAKLPRPSKKLSGALRGLSALSGSSRGGGSYKLPGVGGKGPTGVKQRSNPGSIRKAPGYRGTGRRSPSSGGGPEALKAAGARQADIFNRRGSAAEALNAAAKEAIPGGGGGGGGGGPEEGKSGKGPGTNSTADNKGISGESLEFLRKKLEMQKALDLKWKKIEWDTFGKQKMIEEKTIEFGFEFLKKAFMEPVAEQFADFINPKGGAGGKASVCICIKDGAAVKEVPAGDVVDKAANQMTYKIGKEQTNTIQCDTVYCTHGGSPSGEGGDGGDTPPPATQRSKWEQDARRLQNQCEKSGQCSPAMTSAVQKVTGALELMNGPVTSNLSSAEDNRGQALSLPAGQNGEEGAHGKKAIETLDSSVGGLKTAVHHFVPWGGQDPQPLDQQNAEEIKGKVLQRQAIEKPAEGKSMAEAAEALLAGGTAGEGGGAPEGEGDLAAAKRLKDESDTALQEAEALGGAVTLDAASVGDAGEAQQFEMKATEMDTMAQTATTAGDTASAQKYTQAAAKYREAARLWTEGEGKLTSAQGKVTSDVKAAYDIAVGEKGLGRAANNNGTVQTELTNGNAKLDAADGFSEGAAAGLGQADGMIKLAEGQRTQVNQENELEPLNEQITNARKAYTDRHEISTRLGRRSSGPGAIYESHMALQDGAAAMAATSGQLSGQTPSGALQSLKTVADGADAQYLITASGDDWAMTSVDLLTGKYQEHLTNFKKAVSGSGGSGGGEAQGGAVADVVEAQKAVEKGRMSVSFPATAVQQSGSGS